MKKNLLDILACPGCGSSFVPTVFREENFAANEIMDGMLRCRQCSKNYPIIDGIPRFVPNALASNPGFLEKYPAVIDSAAKKEFLKVHGSTQERFSYEWMKYPGRLEEDKEVFLNETQIDAAEWNGKRVLDGGCGMGRYSMAAHELGADVVAMDIGTALVRLWEAAKASARMHIVQGDLMSPPFKEKSFDIVYSVGVIHHTPSAAKAFKNISALVRSGGKLSVWVYGAPGSYKNFKTNPLREDRKSLSKIRFLVWLTVWLREKISDTLRIFTVHMPHNILYYGLCYILAGIGKIPLVKYLTFSVHPLWRVRLQENFDWLTPPYQSHHTKEEVIRWFQDNGFEVQKVLPHGFVPKPGAVGARK